jgi:hypothetical protein
MRNIAAGSLGKPTLPLTGHIRNSRRRDINANQRKTNHWDEATIAFKTYNTVHSAIKKQIIAVFEPMYLEILNDDLVGFANTTAIDMLVHLFLSYGSIMAVYIKQNFENMRNAWNPQQPVDT